MDPGEHPVLLEAGKAVIAIRLKSGNRVLREVVFKALPVRIGRGPDNDLVLFDGSVSSAHAVIEESADGRPVLRDLGSRNGTHAGGARVATVPVGRTLECMIGLTELEIESLLGEPTSRVDVKAWQQHNRRRGFRDHARFILVGTLAWIGFTAGDASFWSPWESQPLVTLLWGVLGVILVMPMAAFVLLIGLRAAGRRVRIADTLEALARLAWLLPAWQALSILAYYLFPTGAFLVADTLLVGLAFVLAVSHVGSLRQQPPRRSFRWALASGAAFLYVALIGTSMYAARARGTPQTDYRVYPPVGGFAGSSRTLEQYQASITEATAAADAEVAKRRAQTQSSK